VVVLVRRSVLGMGPSQSAEVPGHDVIDHVPYRPPRARTR
jgi:hypothetical protein